MICMFSRNLWICCWGYSHISSCFLFLNKNSLPLDSLLKWTKRNDITVDTVFCPGLWVLFWVRDSFSIQSNFVQIGPSLFSIQSNFVRLIQMSELGLFVTGIILLLLLYYVLCICVAFILSLYYVFILCYIFISYYYVSY